MANRSWTDRECEKAKMPLSDSFKNTLQDDQVGGKLFESMQMLFHLSVSVSPIMAFHTQKLYRASVRRDHVMAVSIMLHHLSLK
jgi:hypothetical protein